MLTDTAVSTVADEILRNALRGSHYERVAVHSGLDHDGDPALFIDAILEKNVPPVAGEIINSALASLRAALLQNDEGRFPYLRLVHPDDMDVEGAQKYGPRGRARGTHG